MLMEGGSINKRVKDQSKYIYTS